MTELLDDGQFMALTAKISRERGFGCASYKDKCLRRRIAVRMRAKGVHTYEDYARMLDTDPGEYERLLDALTINVTKLFRNWEVYDAISRVVIPVLWDRPGPIRVWSAGCSSGEEPYSLAVLFHRHAEMKGELSKLNRVQIRGTDIDRESLAAAERGSFGEAAFADTPAHLRLRYFPGPAPVKVEPAVRALISFEQRDLLREPAPASNFDMVICRNVLIYFDRATQEKLFDRFHEALIPSGFLVLGKVETLLGESRSRFAPIEARERIFRRL
jgi:chemotaxis methyl-accepting protein methylase